MRAMYIRIYYLIYTNGIPSSMTINNRLLKRTDYFFNVVSPQTTTSYTVFSAYLKRTEFDPQRGDGSGSYII